MNDDIGDMDNFEQPHLDDEVINALTALVIDESPTEGERIAEDIDNLIDAVGMEYMEPLKSYLMRGDVADSVCDSPVFRAAVARRIEAFRDALSGIDFNDTGDL